MMLLGWVIVALLLGGALGWIAHDWWHQGDPDPTPPLTAPYNHAKEADVPAEPDLPPAPEPAEEPSHPFPIVPPEDDG